MGEWLGRSLRAYLLVVIASLDSGVQHAELNRAASLSGSLYLNLGPRGPRAKQN